MEVPCLNDGLLRPKTHSLKTSLQDPKVSMLELKIPLFVNAFENVDLMSISQNTAVNYCMLL